MMLLTSFGILHAQSAAPAASEPVAYSSIHELNQLLDPLQHLSQSTQADLAKLRVERWKTDSNTKHQTQANLDSITRNLHDALPELISSLRNSPESLPATFKLYRNLDALYDVFVSLTESAGAFGTKDEFQSLDNDLALLEQSRHSFADRMSSLATQKEEELVALHTKIQQAQTATATAATSVKKTVVDDAVPQPKKPVKKKVKSQPAPAATPAPAPPAPAANPN